jgi:hypothetical protein
MRKIQIILILILLSCNSVKKEKISNCINTREYKLGYVSFFLPDCYKIVYQDTLDTSHGYLVKGDSIYFRFYMGGGIEEDQIGKIYNVDSIIVLTDTFSIFLKQIVFNKNGTKYWFIAEVSGLIPFQSILDSSKCRYPEILSFETNSNITLSKTDKDMLVKSFINSKIDATRYFSDEREFQNRLDSINNMFYSSPSKTYHQMN